MNQKSILKIFSVIISISFIFGIFFPFISKAIEVTDINGNSKLDWDNPYNSKNPYQFDSSNTLDSNLLMKVVGCTGIVDKVSKGLSDFLGEEVNSSLNKISKELDGDLGSNILGGEGSVPVKSSTIENNQKALQSIADSNKKREECFNGIAYVLAKKQLTDMTKYTMNWVTTGFNGDPMYLRNAESFMENLADTIIQEQTGYYTTNNGTVVKEKCLSYSDESVDNTYNEWLQLNDNAQAEYQQQIQNETEYPLEDQPAVTTWESFLVQRYGEQEAGVINDYNQFLTIRYPNGVDVSTSGVCTEWESSNVGSIYPYSTSFSRSYLNTYKDLNKSFSDTMKTTIYNYLESGSTIDDFANNFSVGGWDGWLALTQFPQNNPLGYTMTMGQKMSDDIKKKKENTQKELDQNGGFLSQKKCVKDNESTAQELWKNNKEQGVTTLAWEDWKKENYPNGFTCVYWETVTPGSLIKDKVSTYLNTPERQLEIADSINEVLSMLFTNMISKFQNQGLTSLTSNYEDFSDANLGGEGSNYSVSLYSSLSGGYSDPSFDIIKDIGNTYYNTEDLVYAGDWNANINRTISLDGEMNDSGLYKNTGVKNNYYKVTTAGNTSLFDGNNSWSVGDKAVYTGDGWIKWLKGAPKPIKKRGAIQIQQDYIEAATEAERTLPPIMPAIGELDYCIPGPNSNWAYNSTNTREKYFDYIDGYTVVDASSKAQKIALGITNIATMGLVSTIFEALGLDGVVDGTMMLLTPPKKGSVAYTNYKDTFTVDKSESIFDLLKENPLFSVYGKPTISEIYLSDQNYINRMDNKINNTKLMVSKLYKEYYNKIINVYGHSSPMQDEYISLENKEVENLSYLPMASDGLSITKKILSYDESSKEASKNYKESITNANSNIYKLEAIRKRVNQIVKTAQDRRTASLENDGVAIPEQCFVDENITFIDDSELNYNSEYERCNDEIDNDDDGDIDWSDEDCQSVDDQTQVEKLCYDKIDNDEDGLIDEEDYDCSTSSKRN